MNDESIIKSMSNTDREALIAQINATDPHNVFTPAGESRDPDKRKIICPKCGNGTGQDATPVEASWTGDRWLYHCFKCGELEGDLLKIIATDNGLNLSVFADLCKALAIGAELVGIPISGDFKPQPRQYQKTAQKNPPQLSEDYLKLIRSDVEAAKANLAKLPAKVIDSFRRGLNGDTLMHFKFGFIEQWIHPLNRLEGTKKIDPTRRIIIPTSTTHYNAVVPLDDRKDVKKKYWKQHAGSMELFNARALRSDDDLVVVVEGEIDAASIWQAFEGKISVVATLGVANWKATLLPALADVTAKKFLIIFDGEPESRKKADALRGELVKRGFPAVCRFYTKFIIDRIGNDDYSAKKISRVDDKTDANQILVEAGQDFLHDVTADIIVDARADLDAAATELIQPARKRRTKPQVHAHYDRPADLNAFFDGDASDLDFARRLEKICGDRVRWQDDKRWLTFTSGVWTPHAEKNSCLAPFTRQLAEIMDDYARDENEHLLANKLKSAHKCNNAINMLKGFDNIRITADELNQHPELLNCKNGVVDLQTGKLLAADPALYLTQQCRADYDPHADNAIVHNFFRDIMPDEMTRAGLLRWLGYCLTGENTAEKFMVWHGAGANGKGVLSATLLELLADYGTGLTPRALLKSSRLADPDAATTSLNALETRRFAISEEVPADGEIDPSLIKNLTGGDPINLRRNYSEYRTIRNLAKINISGNYLPRIENITDGGILRRLLNMPFTVKFGTPEHPADPHLKKKMLLPENLRGLMSILVGEAVRWYRGDDGGLIVSPLMAKETSEHLRQNDFVGEFLDDNYVRVPTATVKAKELIAELKATYPRQCSRFKNADLIKLVETVGGVSYDYDNNHTRVFRGIGKLIGSDRGGCDFGGTPLTENDIPPN